MENLKFKPPGSFANPYETQILRLEKKYARVKTRRQEFTVLKALKATISLLKAELVVRRRKEV
jgi:hypothetical protein